MKHPHYFQLQKKSTSSFVIAEQIFLSTEHTTFQNPDVNYIDANTL